MFVWALFSQLRESVMLVISRKYRGGQIMAHKMYGVLAQEWLALAQSSAEDVVEADNGMLGLWAAVRLAGFHHAADRMIEHYVREVPQSEICLGKASIGPHRLGVYCHCGPPQMGPSYREHHCPACRKVYMAKHRYEELRLELRRAQREKAARKAAREAGGRG